MFHCHIEFHVEVGMALIFKVGEHEDFSSVPAGFPQCGDYLSDLESENEIDFHHGDLADSYNVTVGESNSSESSFVSFVSHLWPRGNSSYAASDAVRYNLSPSLVILLSVIVYSCVNKC